MFGIGLVELLIGLIGAAYYIAVLVLLIYIARKVSGGKNRPPTHSVAKSE